MAKSVVFFDTEVSVSDKKIHDIGAVSSDGAVFHSASVKDFCTFFAETEFLCGHNIVHHDLEYLQAEIGTESDIKVIDTLYLSPLLFPKRPYHALVKDDKLQVDELNNPVNDSQKSSKLFYDEINAYFDLSAEYRQVLCSLLYPYKEFTGFFDYVDSKPDSDFNIRDFIQSEFEGKICANADIESLIINSPIELAYALSLISTEDSHSITPPWLLRNFPKIENVIKYLCGTPCKDGCAYCQNTHNIHKELKTIFGYDSFRTYNGEPLQENAAKAAVDGKSLLAVFPTGGGKSITFQLPALMAGKSVHGLTVVISPLQSLMKDQVDNLNDIGITEAVTINGLLDPIERANAFERLANGSATLLYISPELLRSSTIEKILLSRNVVRFVIDEAHCFSAWGQDFRVDYLYIGDFIRELQKKKNDKRTIPVSCFTATAKQKVISDICDYFKRKLDLNLELFASSATRENLHYTVLYKETDEEKYNALRNLIVEKDCPTIVYVSRTRRTWQIAEKLTSDGFPARPFNGKMDSNDKIENQEAFIRNEIKVIVATSAFGMGVDKKDVKLVIHYDISDSLENYVQEAGRAGRDPNMQAECYVLYNDSDLDKHFILLNQTKLSISEIQQVWKAIKSLTKFRPGVCCSPLEIARQAGWDDSVNEIETRVKTAVSALESAGYIKRGRNMPRIYATSILAKDMAEASFRIEQSALFTEEQRTNAKRIIKSLISNRSIADAGNGDAESRVDYLADTLGLMKEEVIDLVNLMRREGLLDDSLDMSAYIYASDTEYKSKLLLNKFSKLEHFLLSCLTDEVCDLNLKELNEMALSEGINSSSIRNIRTLLHYLTVKNYIQKEENSHTRNVRIVLTLEKNKLMNKFYRRIDICRFILENLYAKANEIRNDKEEKPVQFSMIGLYNAYKAAPKIDEKFSEVYTSDIEDALLYLSKIGALRIEGGFLVLYQGMEIKRLVMDNKIRYKVDDYRFLNEFYKQKIRQIHIVGEYANLMVKNYNAALQFVQDYFQMDFRKFITKYFEGERVEEIDRNITPKKYHQLFGELSDTQSKIINDSDSKYIVVAAGPGSGKTRVLVHKLAALLLMEDVKHEQLLMLTFSRAAATEFKKRLVALIGNAANFVEIKTFHSYCFDLLGKIGSLDGVQDVVKNAAKMINNGEVEPGRITKSVLVIDEAQDMDQNEFNLVQALMRQNDDMRVIAVGDDDQNIYEFRGSNSKYMRSLIDDYGAVKYEMTENYRCMKSIVAFSNSFLNSIDERMKFTPIQPVSDENGTVMVIRHQSKYIISAVVDQLIETRAEGKACVLTNTNDEALQVLGLLTKKGVRAKLIQDVNGFRLYDLAEIRFLLKVIDRELNSPVISDDLWNKAKQRLNDVYKDSNCLENCINLMNDFEIIYPIKYRTDLEEFIKESNYEDFYTDAKEIVYVSTIHKSKGREFDNVYMLLSYDQNRADTNQERRKLYVGMTRAKKALYIHCNYDFFPKYMIPEVIFKDGITNQAEPKEISLQLTHKDVVLDFFKDKRREIFELRSGEELLIDNPYLYAVRKGGNRQVVKMSKGLRKKLNDFQKKGYYPYSASVRFVVAWKGKEDTEETPVVLLNLFLRKK